MKKTWKNINKKIHVRAQFTHNFTRLFSRAILRKNVKNKKIFLEIRKIYNYIFKLENKKKNNLKGLYVEYRNLC